MKKLFTFLLVLLFLVPPTPVVQETYEKIPREMWKMTERFEASIGVDLKHAEVKLLNLYKKNIIFALFGAIGYCEAETDIVYIHKPYWDRVSDTEREVLLYHEYGHCYLNLRHIKYMEGKLNPENPKHCPMTIMYPTSFREECYEENRWFYLETLKFHYNTAIPETHFDEDM